MNSKKATEIDTVFPKLMRLAVNFSTPLSTRSGNSCIKRKLFFDLAKSTLVVPLDKEKSNKNENSDLCYSRYQVLFYC